MLPPSSRSTNPTGEDPTFKSLVGAVPNSDLYTDEFAGKQARTAEAKTLDFFAWRVYRQIND